MINPLLLPELREMLESNDTEALAEVMQEWHPATVAEFSEGLSPEETWKMLGYAPIVRQAEVLPYFPLEKQVEMVTGANRERVGKLLEAMSHDSRVELLRALDPHVVEDLLPLMAKADRQDIRQLLSYPESSAGALMTTEYASVPADITVSEALARLREQAPHSETIYYIFVLDEDRHLIGTLSLHELILAKPTVMVRDLMQTEIITVRVDQDQEEVAKILARYDFLAIPVVDDQRRLVGIITHDDALDVVIEEATEDAMRMGGVGNLEENYLEAPFTTIWRKRAIWLSCLFVAELFTFTAMASFEHAIEAIVALSLFIPLCISTGGNSGSQAATLITRAMALGHVKPADWWRVLKHELWMGIVLGLTLGLIGFLRAGMTPESVLGKADRWTLALVIGQSVAFICLWGTLIGAMLPLIFKRLGFDPAYASSPFVATFVDVTGIVIYFTIATVWLLQPTEAETSFIAIKTMLGLA